MTRAVVESMVTDTGVKLPEIKVDGGMTNGDKVMEILADLSGVDVVRPEMRECVHSFRFTTAHPVTRFSTCCCTDLLPSAPLSLPALPSNSSVGTSRSLRLFTRSIPPEARSSSPRPPRLSVTRSGEAGNAPSSAAVAGLPPTKSEKRVSIYQTFSLYTASSSLSLSLFRYLRPQVYQVLEAERITRSYIQISS